MELDAIITQYIATLENRKAPKTVREKKYSLLRFAQFVGTQSLTPDLVFNYIHWLETKPIRPYKNNSLRTEITLLKTFEKWMLKNGKCQVAFTTLLELPQKEQLKDFVYVDPEMIDKAIEAGTTPKPFIRRGLPGDNALNKYRKLETRACLKFISRRGLRIEEALRLQGSDLNFDCPKPLFRIAPIKGHKETWVEIPADMVEELRSRKDRGRAFETTEKLCNLSLQRGWVAVGLKGYTHNHILRHEFVTNLLKNNVPMEKVQKAARHSSIKITIDTYGHLDNSDVDPLIQSADPRTRQALSYEEQVTFLEQQLERLRLGHVGLTEVHKTTDEFTYTLRRKGGGKHEAATSGHS